MRIDRQQLLDLLTAGAVVTSDRSPHAGLRATVLREDRGAIVGVCFGAHGTVRHHLDGDAAKGEVVVLPTTSLRRIAAGLEGATAEVRSAGGRAVMSGGDRSARLEEVDPAAPPPDPPEVRGELALAAPARAAAFILHAAALADAADDRLRWVTLARTGGKLALAGTDGKTLLLLRAPDPGTAFEVAVAPAAARALAAVLEGAADGEAARLDAAAAEVRLAAGRREVAAPVRAAGAPVRLASLVGVLPAASDLAEVECDRTALADAARFAALVGDAAARAVTLAWGPDGGAVAGPRGDARVKLALVGAPAGEAMVKPTYLLAALAAVEGWPEVKIRLCPRGRLLHVAAADGATTLDAIVMAIEKE